VRRLLALGAILLAWSGPLAGRLALADHAGTLQVNEQAGPFVLTVFTQPARLRTDDCQVSVVVMRLDRIHSVSDAEVRVGAVRRDGAGPPVAVVAAHGRGPLYEASLALPSAGGWTVTIEVTSPLGTGSSTFPLDVEAASWRVWWMTLGGIAAIGAVAGWLAWRWRRHGVGHGIVSRRRASSG